MKIEIIKDENTEETQIKIICKEVDESIDKIVTLLKTIDISIIGKLDNDKVMLNLQDIYYFEAVENKVFAYLKEKVYEVSYKIAELNEMLNKTSFIQTSRTIILNVNKIKRIQTMVNGRILAEFNNSEKMIITRVYANQFKEKIKGGK